MRGSTRRQRIASGGQPDRARTAYGTAVKLFPETDAGRLSKQRLDGLNRRPR